MRSDADISGLIRAARADEAGALDRLLRLYRNYLRYLASAGIGRALGTKADPSDVVQDALLRAFQGFAEFRGETEAELLAWLRQILARQLTNLVRHYRQTDKRDIARERPMEEVLYDSSVALGRVLRADVTSPIHGAQQRERSVIIADALAQLPDDHAEVIRLRNLEQLGWEETGRRMDRSAGAVRQLWARAVQNLAPLLEGRRL